MKWLTTDGYRRHAQTRRNIIFLILRYIPKRHWCYSRAQGS